MGTYDRMELINEIEALEAEFGFELTVSKRLTDLTDLQLLVLRDGLAAAADESLKD
jgi:hypothetical protein